MSTTEFAPSVETARNYPISARETPGQRVRGSRIGQSATPVP